MGAKLFPRLESLHLSFKPCPGSIACSFICFFYGVSHFKSSFKSPAFFFFLFLNNTGSKEKIIVLITMGTRLMMSDT